MPKSVINQDFTADLGGSGDQPERWKNEVQKRWSHTAPLFVMILKVYFHTQQVYDQKNIRRRVYDALNVLMAMNIISKEKKEIRWIGLPTNSAQECRNLEVCVCVFQRQIHII